MELDNHLRNFFLPVKLTKEAFKAILMVMFGMMALVFAGYFFLGLIAILRNPSSNQGVDFNSLPFNALSFAFETSFLAFAIAYVLYVVMSKSVKFNLMVILCVIVILHNGWFFWGQASGFFNTKTAIYKVNLMQDPKDIQKLFADYQHYPINGQKYILEAIALNPFASSQTLEQIAKIDDKDLHNNIDSIFYFQPNNSQGLAVMGLIAKNPNASPSTLEVLAKSPSIDVIGEVAQNERTPTSVLESLWQKYPDEIAEHISKNPKTSPLILETLSHKKYPTNSQAERVKANVAKNPNTPSQVLEELSKENSAIILQYLIDNQKIPLALLQKLTTHPNEKVSQYAKAKLQRLRK